MLKLWRGMRRGQPNKCNKNIQIVNISNSSGFWVFNNVKYYSSKVFEGKATKEGTASFFSQFANLNNADDISPPSRPPSEHEEMIQKELIKTKKKTEMGQSLIQQILPKRNDKTNLTLHPFMYSTQRLNPYDMGHQNVLSTIISAGVNTITANSLQPISEIILNDAFENLELNRQGSNIEKNIEASPIATYLASNVPSHMDIARENLVICTKGGFVLEDNKKTKFPIPISYNLEPSYIRGQIMESLQRLGVDCIDFFLIERPEVLFKLKKYSKDDLYSALTTLFKELEALSRLGHIQYYGICSETLSIEEQTHPFSISLSKVLHCAELAGGAHHKFAVVEYPFNMVESDSFLNHLYPSPSSPSSQLSLVDFANEYGLISIGSRPLTAKLTDKKKVRLISYPLHDDKDIAALINEAINYVAILERNYQDGVEFRTNLPDPSNLQWTRNIASSQSQLDTIDKWKDAMDFHIKPKLQETLQEISKNSKVHTHFFSFPTRYHIATSKLFERIEWSYESKAHHITKPLITYLGEMDELLGKADLQTNALRFAMSVPQSCVTVGLRADHLIPDLFSTLYYPPIERNRLTEILLNIRAKKFELFQ